MTKAPTRINCPVCGKRIMDVKKETAAGQIETKCTHCRRVVEIDLAKCCTDKRNNQI